MRLAWSAGELQHVLRYAQHLAVRDAYYATPALGRLIGLISRQFGKSRCAVTLANETAWKYPGLPIRYAAQTQGEVLDIIEPHMRDILSTCPVDMRPAYKSNRGHWEWPNGSTLHVAGCDNLKNAERLRGPKASLVIVDEAGFIEDLEYIVRSILSPQLLTTGGRMLMISTPSRTGEHPFMKDFVPQAQASGQLITFTIDDAPHLSEEDKAAFIAQVYGSPDTPAAQRELYCVNMPDPTRSVVPEFSRLKGELVAPWTRPRYFRPYVGGDFGFKDSTAIVFGYLDFDAGLFIIEDEVIMDHSTTHDVAQAIKMKEAELWGYATEDQRQEARLKRIADAPPMQIADLARIGLGFGAASKDDKDASIAELRRLIQRKRIRIHPRCKGLIAHLEHGIWNKARTSFERSGDFGHFDAIDALRYVLRVVDFNKNPYPDIDPADVSDLNRFISPAKLQAAAASKNKLAKVFKPAPSRTWAPKR
jgi:hypothetical protein